MANFTETPELTNRYGQALQFAFEAHRLQIRKQGAVPYISHLMSVSALVLEAGGTEDEAIAALLHDAVEDAEISKYEIAVKFGFDVGSIVANLTEQKELPKEHRKAEYVRSVDFSSDSVKLVSCADKMHNLRSYFTDGRHLWKADTSDFYAKLMPVYEGCYRVPRHWIFEMKQMLNGMNKEMETRPCQCGSEQLWVTCSENSRYCG